MSFALMMLCALALDVLVGWPDWVFRRIGHPVTWIGAAISAFEAALNQGSRRARLLSGALTAIIIVATVTALFYGLQSLLPGGTVGTLLGSLLAWPLVAARSLHSHVIAVARPLADKDIENARLTVSHIVGRDPNLLDTAGIARASIESLSENTSDGIVAPLFWGLIAGLPGIAAYKAINTLDSMIGHKNDRYEAFGKAAARLDDVVNYLPSRLNGLLFAIASGRHFRACLGVMAQDSPKHRSPNAGWPEGAMAAALGVRLSGARQYGDRVADEPWLNATAPDPGAHDIYRALRLYWKALLLVAASLAVLAFAP